MCPRDERPPVGRTLMEALIFNLILCAALAAGMTFASPLLGPKSELKGEKGLPYETGMKPMGPPSGRMAASYYRFAVLFFVFDVDLAFLIPWVWLKGQATLGMMLSMSAFLAMVALTLAYVWRKGALRC